MGAVGTAAVVALAGASLRIPVLEGGASIGCGFLADAAAGALRVGLQGCVGADVGVDALTEAGVAVIEGVAVFGAVVAVGGVLDH